MTELTILDPTAAAAAAAAAVPASLAEGVIVTDSKGRKLKIKQLDLLAESRLVRGLGEAAANATYLNAYALPAAMVVEMDGDELDLPITPRMVEAAIQRLGREGMDAIIKCIMERAEQSEDANAAVKK